MRFLAKVLLILLLNSLFIIRNSGPVSALATFSTDYTVIYDINDKGVTRVSFNIAQKNNLSTVYATSFSLSLSQTNLSNIRVQDSQGQITPQVDRTDNLTNISFDFLDKVVGKDKVNQFSIQFDSADIANQQGSIWEVNIPKLETNENTTDQQVILKVPGHFGPPAYIDPKPSRIEGNTYYFSSTVLSNKSISAVFGTTQYFKLNLVYNLTNPLPKTLNTQIALPPDTAYQTVYLKNLSPAPKDIASDPDGNWLASYTIEPNTDLQVNADLVIKLSFTPRTAAISNTNLYTRATKYWNYEDSDVAIKALGLATPKAVYDFVVNSLGYDYTRVLKPDVVRPGATWALANPSRAICTEFTDLFIALARKNGIPARELQGYALSSNDKLKPLSLSKDILHAWPEYYDSGKQTWIQIDPTWSNTTGGIDYFNKLDLNHLVFVIHGIDPQEPLPAGAYKTIGGGSKDVFVSLTAPENFPPALFQVSYFKQDREHLYLTLANTSGVSGEFLVETQVSSLTSRHSSQHYLPPHSQTTLEVDLNNALRFYPKKEQLIIKVNGQPTTLDLTYQPNLPLGLLWGTAISATIGFTLIARGLYLRRRKTKPPVHW